MVKSNLLKKFLFIFYLFISSSIINVHSNIQYSKEIDKFLFKLTDLPKNLILLEDPISEKIDKNTFDKLINFILGMMRQIPGLKNKAILLESLIDLEDKPECSSQKLLDKYHSVSVTDELVEMAKRQEPDDVFKNILADLGEKEQIEQIDWTNPRMACKKVLRLHKEKSAEIRKSIEKSTGLYEFGLKVYVNNETFEEFYTKIGSGLTKLFHRERIKLYDFILKINFDGNAERMKSEYRDYNKWREDLQELLIILNESETVSREIQESLLSNSEEMPDCDDFPTDNQLQNEITKFTNQYVGGIMVLKQVSLCLGVQTMIFSTLIRMGIIQIIRLISMMLGFIFAQIVKIAIVVTQIGYFLYKGLKTDVEKNLKLKYRYYGRSAGAMFNLLCALLGG